MSNYLWSIWVGLLIVWGMAVLPMTAAFPLATTPLPTLLPPDMHYRFAVIGDYGDNSPRAARVAHLVASWDPDFVLSLGDNNYPNGEAATIDDNVGQYYGQFIGNYQGSYGSGSPTNRFWPTLGNHDWLSLSCDPTACRGPYFDYFSLPGNERYYDVNYGLIHLFAVDGDFSEPDGNRRDGVQANWLQAGLMASTSCFKIVFFHNAPYSSGYHGSQVYMQWPFADWGADVVLSGHDHDYERLDVAGLPYFVNGVGGGSITSFANEGNLPDGVTSLKRYNHDGGAMLVEVTTERMLLQFYNTEALLVDEYALNKTCRTAPPATLTLLLTPRPTNPAAPRSTHTATPGTVITPVPPPTNTPTRVTATVTATAVAPISQPPANPAKVNDLVGSLWLLVTIILLAGWLVLRSIKQQGR